MAFAEGDGSQATASPGQVGLQDSSLGEELVTRTTGLLRDNLVLPSCRPEPQNKPPGEVPRSPDDAYTATANTVAVEQVRTRHQY